MFCSAQSEVRQTGLSTRGDGGYKTLLHNIYVTQTAFSVTETNESGPALIWNQGSQAPVLPGNF